MLGASHPGPFARLGAWAATHFRRVLIAWVLVLLVFGIFAVHVENALAGAGWQASNSQSVAARAIIEKDFSGLGATALQVVIVDHHGPIASDPKAQAAVVKATNVLRSDPRVSTVVPPQAGVSLSRDGRTAVITAGSAANSNKMVQAADSVQPKLAALSSSGVSVTLTGDSALWANFNTANRSAMLRSEMLSWPVTIIILVIAFGSLVAAGLPLAPDHGRTAGGRGRVGHHHQVHARLHLGPQLRADVRPRSGHRLRALLGHALPCRPQTPGRRTRRPRGDRRVGG